MISVGSGASLARCAPPPSFRSASSVVEAEELIVSVAATMLEDWVFTSRVVVVLVVVVVVLDCSSFELRLCSILWLTSL